MQKFGTAVSQDILVLEKKDPYKEVEIIHAVYPRADFNPTKKDKKNMPFESVYIEFKNGNEDWARKKRKGGGCAAGHKNPRRFFFAQRGRRGRRRWRRRGRP